MMMRALLLTVAVVLQLESCEGLFFSNPAPETTVAFTAELSSHLGYLYNFRDIIFSRIITNEGDEYNPATGRFTCPVKGIYVFSTKVFTAVGRYAIIEITKNGEGVSFVSSAGWKNWYGSGSTTVTLKLNEGDMVWVRVHGPHYSHGYGEVLRRHYTDFTGFLLKQIA